MADEREKSHQDGGGADHPGAAGHQDQRLHDTVQGHAPRHDEEVFIRKFITKLPDLRINPAKERQDIREAV